MYNVILVCVFIIIYLFDSGNKKANMCEGDMVFYWIKQEEQSGQQFFVVGEGPNSVANETTIHKLEINHVLSQVKMYGALETAYFLYGE